MFTNTKFPFGRHAHASVLVGSKVYIFGGHRMNKPVMLMNDLGFIDLALSLEQGKIFDNVKLFMI